MIYTEEERKKLMAQRLRDLREGRNLTLEALSELLHGSPSRNTLLSYEKKENTTNNNINLQGIKLAELAEFYNVSTDYLLGLSDDHDKKPTAVDELKITVDAKEALKKIASRHPTDREALSTFIESDEFSDLIGHFRALQTTENTYQQLTAPYLISRYGYSPGESIEDPINQLRLLRLEIEDCITHYLESEYHYSEIKKDLQNNIDLALAAIEAEEENSDGIT